MKKAALIDAVQAELQCGPQQAKAIVADFFALVEEGVADDGQTSLASLGTFERRRRAARPARDVARGQTMVLPERDAIVFRPAPALRADVAAPGEWDAASAPSPE